MEEKLNLERIVESAKDKTLKNDFKLGFAAPQYLDVKKEYYTKDEKVYLINFIHTRKFYSTIKQKFHLALIKSK
jgi:hypothetical protein